MPEPYVFRGGIFSVGIGPIPKHPAPASRSGQDSYVSKGGHLGGVGGFGNLSNLGMGAIW